MKQSRLSQKKKKSRRRLRKSSNIPAEVKQEDNPQNIDNKNQRKEEVFMQIRPLGDRILVKPLEAEEKTKGGIILPDTAKEKPQEGRVVAVGKGKILEDGKIQPLEVKPQDKILYSKYAGTEIKIDGEEHLIIREEDVLAIITD